MPSTSVMHRIVESASDLSAHDRHVIAVTSYVSDRGFNETNPQIAAKNLLKIWASRVDPTHRAGCLRES